MSKFVEVFQQTPWGGKKPLPAGVNWQAMGTVTPAKARQFAAAIIAAADQADEMNRGGGARVE